MLYTDYFLCLLPMKISRLLRSELIEPNLTLADKDRVLEYLVRLAMPCLKGECEADAERILTALREREEVTSTGIGNGVAIPHAKIEGLKKMVIAFARSPGGVSFQALDDAPVYLIFLVIAPPEAISDYLKLLAAISAFLRCERNRQALQKATTRAEIFAAIKAGEGQ
jgi:mannitol/fructose-specific phosphotransferase system IIA component (Ntr-type)